MKNWMKKLGIAVMCISLAMGINVCGTSAAMLDQAVPCEFGELYTGTVTREDESHTYYKFTLDERSRVTLKVNVDDTSCFMVNVYNENSDVVIPTDALHYTYNAVVDTNETQVCRTLESGTYYIELYRYYNYGSNVYSFSVQNEEQIKLPKGKISSLKSKKKGQITVKCKPSSDALGYYIQYSTDYRFKSGVKTVLSPVPARTIKKLSKGRIYYVKVCPYSVYDDGTYVFGQNSSIKKVKVKR